jgi:thiamine biosynthesis lipoprotein
MTDQSDSTRRDFLTGRAAHRALRSHGEKLADAIADAAGRRAPPQADDTVRLETRAMACSWAVVMNPGPPRQVMVASDALDRVHVVEDQLTVYRDHSDIARVNRTAAEQPQQVSEDLFAFLLLCQELWKATEGAFDPATGALIQLWRAARARGSIPHQDDVAAALSRSGMHHVHLNAAQRTIAFDIPGVLLDFGAVGKGYAADLAAKHLDEEDLENYLVHGGHSSLFARGNHAGHDGWPVGIKNPLFTDRRYVSILLKDCGMSTSGSNVQYFRYRGERYGHILHPQTGWPAGGLLSVTVLAPTAAEADALSTAFYVMGLDKALRYCDHRPEIGTILVPPPVRGRELEPVIRNLPNERLFFEDLSKEN